MTRRPYHPPCAVTIHPTDWRTRVLWRLAIEVGYELVGHEIDRRESMLLDIGDFYEEFGL